MSVSFRLKEKHPDVTCLPVSAKTECVLQEMKEKGLLKYECGSSTYSLVDNLWNTLMLGETKQNVLEK